MCCGGRNERDIAENAAEPPHILVFEVAAVGPLVDLDREQVLAGLDLIRDIELRLQAAALAETDWFPVNPEVKC